MQQVRVEGDQQATVGQLRSAVAKATGVEPTKHRIIRMTNSSAIVLDDDAKLIKKDFSIWSGEEVILELVNENDEKENCYTAYNSAIIKTYEDKKNRVSINFNKPGEKQFENCVIVDKRDSLLSLKEKIAATLEIKDVNKFRLKLHARAPVLKDLDKSMKDNNLSDGSVVFVEKGVQPKADELILLFYRYTPNEKDPFKAFSKALFSKSTKVKDVKLRISKHPKANGHSADKIRLRVRGKSGKDVGAILRDDQTLGASVKRLSDNDRFAVQFLDTEESVTSKDAVISLTLWRPLLQSLEKKIEVVVSKCVTTLELHEKLVRLYGDNWCVGASDSPGASGGELQKCNFCVAKLRTLGGITAKVVYGRSVSGKGIQWVSLNDKNVVAMKTDVGRLVDGANLLVVDSKELNEAIQRMSNNDSMPQSPDTSQKASLNRPRPPPPRNSIAGKRGTNSVISFPKRREVGVKIATVFDSPPKNVQIATAMKDQDISSSMKSNGEDETLEIQRQRLFGSGGNGNKISKDATSSKSNKIKAEENNLDDSVVMVV